MVRSNDRLAHDERAGNRASWNRSQVPEAYGVRAPHGVREPRACGIRRQDDLGDVAQAAERDTARSRGLGSGDDRSRARTFAARRRALAWSEAVARDRYAADAGSATLARGRAGRGHDAAGGRAHRGAVAVARG